MVGHGGVLALVVALLSYRDANPRVLMTAFLLYTAVQPSGRG